MSSEYLTDLIQITDADFEQDRVKHKAYGSSLRTPLETIRGHIVLHLLPHHTC